MDVQPGMAVMRSLAALIAIYVAMCLPSIAQAPDSNTFTFRTEINLVKVDVKVYDGGGGTVRGLSAADFLLFDENQPTPISHFASETEPLDLVLLLDVSNSMTRSLSAMAAKTREALAQLHDGDRVAVALFAARSEVAQPLTGDFHEVQTQILGSIYKQSLGSGTLVNEALLMTANYLQSEPVRGRRAVLIVTDNQNAKSSIPAERVVRALSGANITVNAVVTGNSPDRPAASRRYSDPAGNPPDVAQYVSRTGGELLTAESPAASFRKIVESILTRYAMDYAAPSAPPGSFRRIRVELSPEAKARFPGARVEARDGYYAAK